MPEAATSATPPHIERLEVDGIPTWISHHPNRYTGALLFRVGFADEELARHGQTHIVEHLALYELGSRTPYSYNGYVSGLITGFGATGRPEEVAAFLGHVARSLRDLPFARLKDETRVMRSEAAGRTLGFMEELFWMRYGATGHGLRWLPELALYAPDMESIRAWVSRHFTAGNAALWFSGPPPPGLRLDLPPGPRIPCPELHPIENIPFPCSGPAMGPHVGMTFEHTREDWLSVPLSIVQGRVYDRLRYQRGLTYDVALGYEPIAADRVHAALAVNCFPQHAGEVRDALVATVDAMAKDGATDEEMARGLEQYRRGMEDPDWTYGHLQNAASNELLGYRVRTPADLLEEMTQFTSAEIGRRMAAAKPSRLLIYPAHLPSPGSGFLGYPLNSKETVQGKKFRPMASRFPWSKGPRLVLGMSGASLLFGNDRTITVLNDNCAAAALEPNGMFTLYGKDGFQIVINPNEWRGVASAIAEAADRVPTGRLVRVSVDPVAPPVPQPDRAPSP